MLVKRSLGAGPRDPSVLLATLMARVAFLPPERLHPEFKSGLNPLMLPFGCLRGRNLGLLIYYVIQEIYWRPEGSTENVLDLFPVGKAYLKDTSASCY